MSGNYISKIPVLVVALVIGIVLVTSAVVPLASDYSDAKTFTNDGYFRMSKIASTGDDVTITWDYTKPYVFSVNGVDNTIPSGVTSGDVFPYTIMCAETWAVRFSVTDSGATISLQLYGSGADYIWHISNTDNYDVTCTFESGTFSISREGGSATTQSYTEAYIIDNTGDYVLKKGNSDAYLYGDSVIYSVGRSYGTFGDTSSFMTINVQATIDDGATVSLIYPSSGYTVDNEVIHYSEVTGYDVDLYKFSNITFDVKDGDNNSYSATYGQVIVPYEVTADPDNPAAYKNLVKVVPLMAFIMLVVAAAGMVYFKNKD